MSALLPCFFLMGWTFWAFSVAIYRKNQSPVWHGSLQRKSLCSCQEPLFQPGQSFVCVWDADGQWHSSIWAIPTPPASWEASRKPEHNPPSRCWPREGTPEVQLAGSAPIPGRNIGGEGDAVVGKRQRRGARDVLPLRGRSASCANTHQAGFLSNTRHTQTA